MKYLRVTFSNGEMFDVPAEFIARNRAEYYVEVAVRADEDIDAKKLLQEEIDWALEDEYEIADWASNNMDWSDVREVARRVHQTDFNYENEWCNIDHEIIEK